MIFGCITKHCDGVQCGPVWRRQGSLMKRCNRVPGPQFSDVCAVLSIAASAVARFAVLYLHQLNLSSPGVAGGSKRCCEGSKGSNRVNKDGPLKRNSLIRRHWAARSV
jgi:hypothetical protein